MLNLYIFNTVPLHTLLLLLLQFYSIHQADDKAQLVDAILVCQLQNGKTFCMLL
jgi:hypothetical protein